MDQDIRDGLLAVRNFLLKFRTGTIIGMIALLGLIIYDGIASADNIVEPITLWIIAVLYSRSQVRIGGSRLFVRARLRGIPAPERDPNLWDELRKLLAFAWGRRERLGAQLRRRPTLKRPTLRGLARFFGDLITSVVLISVLVAGIYAFFHFKVAGDINPWSVLIGLPGIIIIFSLASVRIQRAFATMEQIDNAPAQLELQLFSNGNAISDEQLAEEVLALSKLNRRVAGGDRNALIEAREWLTRELVNEVSDRSATAGIAATWWSGLAYFVLGFLMSFLFK